MELLKERILRDGRALSERVLLVDSFLNHQVDPRLMRSVGEAFAERFRDMGITKVVTIEASGIAPAVMAAEALNVPMVIMKKSVSSILREGIIQTEVFSFTKNEAYLLTLKSDFLTGADRVLLIDDFLANGEAAFGAIRLIEDAGARVQAVGAVIAKAFQPGLQKLRAAGYPTVALAAVKRMGDGFIEFEEDEK
ncbi:MAG: xanthine phosphoribosyltransferase [Clostridiales bacterium]|nr:xanthine phosphoribosyltransferase [Clostridiales bacterium]